MILSAEEMTAKIFTLSEQQQQEVIDFVDFLKTKSFRKAVNQLEETQTEGARILQALEEYELLGCMESGDGKLSEDYKQHLWGNE